MFPDLYGEFALIAPVRQFQLVQTSLEVIEMKLVVTRPLTPDEESTLKHSINRSFGYPFELPITYVDDIPRDASGKFRDIYSEVPGADGRNEGPRYSSIDMVRRISSVLKPSAMGRTTPGRVTTS